PGRSSPPFPHSISRVRPCGRMRPPPRNVSRKTFASTPTKQSGGSKQNKLQTFLVGPPPTLCRSKHVAIDLAIFASLVWTLAIDKVHSVSRSRNHWKAEAKSQGAVRKHASFEPDRCSGLAR